jgi:hypothetical protein
VVGICLSGNRKCQAVIKRDSANPFLPHSAVRLYRSNSRNAETHLRFATSIVGVTRRAMVGNRHADPSYTWC